MGQESTRSTIFTSHWYCKSAGGRRETGQYGSSFISLGVSGKSIYRIDIILICDGAALPSNASAVGVQEIMTHFSRLYFFFGNLPISYTGAVH